MYRQLLAWTLLLAYPSVALADPPSDKIRVAYAEQCRYLVNEDWTGLFNQMSPNFRTHNVDGSVQTRTQSINDSKKYGQMFKLTSCNPQIQSVNVSGKQITATVVFRNSAVILQPMPKSVVGTPLKKGDRIDTKALIVDTWSDRGDGTLVLETSTAKSAQRAINGQVLK